MTTIGIYDSGAGGLSVLKEILKRFAGNAIYYFADNAHSPFGARSDEQLSDTLAEGLAKVQSRSDVTVVACNTASTFLQYLSRGTKYECKSQNRAFIISKFDDKPHIKPIIGILPPLDGESLLGGLTSYNPDKTLLLATEGTKRRVCPPAGMKVASTPELASMIESCVCDDRDMDDLLPYLRERLAPFAGVKNVVLGCTHYPLCKKQIAEVLGGVHFFDGTPALLCALSRFVAPSEALPAPINFAFSGEDESEKYSRFLELLVNGNRLE